VVVIVLLFALIPYLKAGWLDRLRDEFDQPLTSFSLVALGLGCDQIFSVSLLSLSHPSAHALFICYLYRTTFVAYLGHAHVVSPSFVLIRLS
jgi:hypothetical protein